MLRLYSRDDIRKVRLIRHLGDMGLNLAGVEFALATVENLLILKRRLIALAGESGLQRNLEQEINEVFQSLNLPVED
jgi:DNA-binding transcriptional MerR regulator